MVTKTIQQRFEEDIARIFGPRPAPLPPLDVKPEVILRQETLPCECGGTMNLKARCPICGGRGDINKGGE